MFSLRWLTFFMFMTAVVAYPFKVDQVYERSPEAASSSGSDGIEESDGKAAFVTSSNRTAVTSSFRSLQQLYDGNKKFRQGVHMSSRRSVDQDPGFMFFGCLDNRLTPSNIFNAPVGSVVTHNNIGNQYSTKDASADAAVAYAVESLQVQHIIVLGHYGCKGVETAITKSQKASRLVRKWIKPITNMYAFARRYEIVKLRDSRKPRRDFPFGIKSAPSAGEPGFHALVEENVKRSVKNLRENPTLKQAFSRQLKNDNGKPIDVFIHGFVYDETTGDVHDLHVSYGSPGKVIPHIPFEAVAAAKNFHRDSPSVKRGKTWDFKAHHM